jgi:CubicO group peptidase (beta-lactamase class C family)
MRIVKLKIYIYAAFIVAAFVARTTAQDVYYPGPWGTWETRTASQVGMNSELLNEAVEFAKSAENQNSKDLRQVIATSFANEPFNTIVGPTKTRGAANGMVVRGGYIVAEWGDTQRVDMTFSVTKSYLSTVAGLALDENLIRDVTDPVKNYIRDGKFDSDHNSLITWQHLLHQTSDWSGELWDKPDWCDRPVGNDRQKWVDREKHAPGTHFKYNDVRVNLLGFCLTNVWRKPLPVVLREKIMDPIGASPTWRWHGYENSWITLDGQRMQSVSGGGHWGGGMFICTRDHARFGYLFLRDGNWNAQQLISKNWIDELRKPAHANPQYGNMWWLNTDQKKIPDVPTSSYYASGFGGNYIYVDPENDLLIVLRWTPNVAGVVKRFVAAVEPQVTR